MGPLRLTTRSRSILLASLLASALATALSSCTDSDENVAPPTIFDAPPHDPKTDKLKTEAFIIKLEQKYKREAFRSAIDVHFLGNGEGRMKVRVTYERGSDPTTAAAIADAAVDLAKRMKREDPSMRDLDLEVDREVRARN
jgi:hypothetical protein